jgi:hypothetical protein
VPDKCGINANGQDLNELDLIRGSVLLVEESQLENHQPKKEWGTFGLEDVFQGERCADTVGGNF